MGLLLGLILIPIVLSIVAVLGYFFGMILVYVPVVNDCLGIDYALIPPILAWIFVGAFVFALFNYRGDKS
jgi:hypothetical protein